MEGTRGKTAIVGEKQDHESYFKRGNKPHDRSPTRRDRIHRRATSCRRRPRSIHYLELRESRQLLDGYRSSIGRNNVEPDSGTTTFALADLGPDITPGVQPKASRVKFGPQPNKRRGSLHVYSIK